MSLPFLLAVLAGVGLLASVALIALRRAWARSGRARPATGGWYLVSVAAIVVWYMALSTGLRSHGKAEIAHALARLPVVSAQELAQRPELLGVPVAIQDVAACAQPLEGASGALAVRTRYAGQEEVEHDEGPDTIEERDYGRDQEIARFVLGASEQAAPAQGVRVDTQALQVVPGGPVTRTATTTNEYSEAAGGNLLEYQDQQTIPCGRTVTVTGVVAPDGPYLALQPLPRELSLLSDRPWADLLRTAAGQARDDNRWLGVWVFFALLLALGQAVPVLLARQPAPRPGARRA